MRLTDEQKEIIKSKGDIKVHAVAGSGKTYTLVHYAAHRKKEKILYLAFNRSVKIEAQQQFSEKGLSNVKIETAHSLAYRNIVFRENYKVTYAYRNADIVQILQLRPIGRDPLSSLVLAFHINRFTQYFCNSSAKKVQELDYISTISDPQALEFAQKHLNLIIDGTRTLLAQMNRGTIPVIHDFYLKKFQLSKPELGFDYILFDEGQDASPVMLDILLEQKKATKVVVGDIHQQIYSWRYAVNALAHLNFKNYSLTTSFRFPQYVANMAMDCLQWKDEFMMYTPVKITGAAKRSKSRTKATIARTNIALLRSAINYISTSSRPKRIYFEGNFSSYTLSGNGSLYDVCHLYNRKTSLIRDPEISKMKSFNALCDYAEQSGDTELLMMTNLVGEYRGDLPYYINKINKMHLDDEKRDTAQMIFSTVHKCKGMEYDSVTLENDFIDSSKVEKFSSRKNLTASEIDKINEEINLRYVAITRTRNKIQFSITSKKQGETECSSHSEDQHFRNSKPAQNNDKKSSNRYNDTNHKRKYLKKYSSRNFRFG